MAYIRSLSGSPGATNEIIVDDTTALANIIINESIKDGTIAVVGGAVKYRWDSSSTASASNTVVVPTGSVGAGRWVLDTLTAFANSIADLRKVVPPNANATIGLLAYSALGDGGGGDFYWDANSTETDNGGTIIEPVGVDAGRWFRKFSGALHAEWFGIKADGKRITDGVTTASSTTFTSATAGFTQSDIGKSILINTPSNLASGTLSGSVGSQNVTGVGVDFTTDIPHFVSGAPIGAGVIYIHGNLYVVNFVTSPTTLLLVDPLLENISSQPYYTESQLATTITGFTNSTTVTLNTAPTITQSGVTAFYATDDTSAFDAAMNAATTIEKFHLKLSAGLIGLSSNLKYTNLTGLTIEGPSPKKSALVDLRKVSTETTYPNANNNYGLLSFIGCNGLRFQGFAIDGSVPVRYTKHSTGGTENGAGSRMGIWLDNCTNWSFHDMGAQGFGARDEHFNVADASDFGIFYNCDIAPNNVAINVGGNVGECNGVRITHCTLQGGVLLGCAAYEVDHCDFSAIRGQALVSDIIGRGMIHHNTFRDSTDQNTGHGIISMFGTGSTSALVNIDHNIIYNCVGIFHAPDGGEGIINLENFQGTAFIDGNTIDRCSSYVTDHGTFICVRGANTGYVTVGQNTFRGRAGSNMGVGIFVHSNVPAGHVTITPGTFWGESIVTKWNLGSGVDTPINLGEMFRGTDLTNADQTITVAGGNYYVLPEATLSTNRNKTLGTTGSPTNGEIIRIERRDVTANTVAIVNGGPGAGTLYTFPVSVKRTADFKFDGTNWSLVNHTKIN